MFARNALVAGATGLIGRHLVQRLLDTEAWDHVVTVGRRPLDFDHPDLEQRTIDFDRLPDVPDFPTADDAFCCLGTTINDAGSEEAFRRVDYNYVVAFAKAAHAHGAEQFAVVSSLGADPDSRVFYSRTKGEMEQAVARIPFRSVQIVRPALLLGERDEPRLGERVWKSMMRPVTPLLVGPAKRYRPIEADDVAAALVGAAQIGAPGVHVYRSDALATFAH